jgi:uncharacterized protein YvpB
MKPLFRIASSIGILTACLFIAQSAYAVSSQEAAQSEVACNVKLGKCNTVSDNCSDDEISVGTCLGEYVNSACCKPKPKPAPTTGSLDAGQCAGAGGICNGTSDSACPTGFGFIGICSGTISNKACCKPNPDIVGQNGYDLGGKTCCLCGAGIADGQCVISPNGSCLGMENSANNPVLKTYVCRPLTSSECASISAGGKGLCPNIPINAASFTGKPSDGPPVATAPTLNVPIPGLQLKPTLTAEKGIYNIPWLGQYIAAAYNYLISASVIAAAIMITYGGFLYIMSSTVGSINTAKSIMSDALIGLFLVLAMFTIIKTISGTTFTNTSISIRNISPIGIALEQANLGIQPAPGEDTSFIQSTGLTLNDVTNGATAKSSSTPEPAAPDANSTPSAPAGTTNPDCNPKDKIPRYAQGQAPWGGKPFGKAPLCVGEDNKTYSTVGNAPCCQAYAYSACGPTSLAMVLKAYGTDVTPETIGKLGIENGLRNCNVGGMSPEAVIGLGRYPDFQVDYSIDDTREVKKTPKRGKDLVLLNQALRAGKPVILLCGDCTVKRIKNGKIEDSHKFGGHFMLLTGIYDDGNYAINDPSMGNYNFISQKELKEHSVLIYIRRKDNAPVAVCKT